MLFVRSGLGQELDLPRLFFYSFAMSELRSDDVFGLVRPAIDIHTLGVSYVEQLLEECGIKVVVADEEVCAAVDFVDRSASFEALGTWLADCRITRLGFSYRLDPKNAVAQLGKLIYQLKKHRLLEADGGNIRGIYFAGLPQSCAFVEKEFGNGVKVFFGDETPKETLEKLGVPSRLIPIEVQGQFQYDNELMQFGDQLIQLGEYRAWRSPDQSASVGYGTSKDSLMARLEFRERMQNPPLMRAHVGPYHQDRKKALLQFDQWCRELASERLLDILSIGTSQLTQSRFGESWEGLPNGGGVPLNSPEEFHAVWKAARPMLVRTYAGTKNMQALARMYEDTIFNAWHTFSLWWFCETDGRGPLSLRDNLQMHFDTLNLVSKFSKPFEPNIPHHFSFRGGDDVTYVFSAVLAMMAAKRAGIKSLVLQNMLNTPRYTSGVQDLAKTKAILHFARALESDKFKVILQPRAGLDFFSPHLEKAKVQLAAVSAMMTDLEPDRLMSPDIVHVVSYSEAAYIADPEVVNESIQITQTAMRAYRELKAKHKILGFFDAEDVAQKAEGLVQSVQARMTFVEENISEPFSPEGFFRMFQIGLLPVPSLWGAKSSFPLATQFKTKVIQGGVKIINPGGSPMSEDEYIHLVTKNLEEVKRVGNVL